MESALAKERLEVVTARNVVEVAVVKNRIQVLPFSCAGMAKPTCCTTTDQNLEVSLILHDITESRDEGAKRGAVDFLLVFCREIGVYEWIEGIHFLYFIARVTT
jgi:hypothetical protein